MQESLPPTETHVEVAGPCRNSPKPPYLATKHFNPNPPPPLPSGMCELLFIWAEATRVLICEVFGGGGVQH